MRLTQEQILEIARRKGYFYVSLRYRDDYLRDRCKKLIKKGLLKKARRYDEGRGDYYTFVKQETINGSDQPPTDS